jgi:hypothetical protein
MPSMPNLSGAWNAVRSFLSTPKGQLIAGGTAAAPAVGYLGYKGVQKATDLGSKAIDSVKQTANSVQQTAGDLYNKAKSTVSNVNPDKLFSRDAQKTWNIDPSLANALGGAGIGIVGGAGLGALTGLMSPNKKKGRLRSMLDNMLMGGAGGGLAGGAVGGLGTEALKTIGMPIAMQGIPGGSLMAAGYSKLPRKDQFGLMSNQSISPFSKVINNPVTNKVQEGVKYMQDMFQPTASASTAKQAEVKMNFFASLGKAAANRALNKKAALDPAIANALGLAGVGALGGGLYGLIATPDKKKGRLQSALTNALMMGAGGGLVGGLGTEAARHFGLPMMLSAKGGLPNKMMNGIYSNLPRAAQFEAMNQLGGPLSHVVSNPLTGLVNKATDYASPYVAGAQAAGNTAIDKVKNLFK